MSQQPLQLYIDTSSRELVQGTNTTVPASLPDVYQGDTLSLALRFMVPTGSVTAPYQDIDYSAAAITVGIGQIDVPPSEGFFTITDTAATQSTANIAYNATAAQVQAAIQAALTTHWSTATVTGNTGGPYTITNGGNGSRTALIGTSVSLTPVSFVRIIDLQDGTADLPSIQYLELRQSPIALQETWTAYPAPTATVTELQHGSGTQNEIQQIALGNNPYAGAFVLNFNGATSAPIAYNASASAVQSALAAVSTIGSGNVSVGGSAGAWVITFTGSLALAAQPLMTTVATGLTGPLAMTGTMALNTSAIEELMGENASITSTFAIQVTPSGGNAYTVYQGTITIFNDLIVGAPSAPTPTVSYYTEAEADALFISSTGSGESLTFPGTLSIASGKTCTVSNTLTLTGTDGAALHIGSGGTLGSGAYSSSYSLPEATTSTLGGVIVGTGLVVSSGTVSVATPLANIDANSGSVDVSGTSLTLPTSCVHISNINASGSAGSSTYLRGDGAWSTPSGTVTSVAMTVPSILSVSGSPVTSSGTLAVTLANENANLVFAGPSSGSATTPTFRSLVAADVPTLNQNTTGTAANLSGTPALPNGTTATEQAFADNSSKLATTSYADRAKLNLIFLNADTGPTNNALTANSFTVLLALDGTGTQTLPSSPVDGTVVILADGVGLANGGTYGFANVVQTVASGSTNIWPSNGGSQVSSIALNRSGIVAKFVYTTSLGGGWLMTAEHPPTYVTATLSSGSVTISNSLISTATPPVPSHNGTSVTNAGALFISAISSGSVTIKSTNASDNDTITLMIP